MIAQGLFILSWVLIITGIIGFFRFKGLYARILNSSKIDSAGVIVLILALMFYTPLYAMRIKLFVILLFYLLTNPVSNQIIANSAYKNGIVPGEE